MAFMNANANVIPNENLQTVLLEYTTANGLYIADIRDNIDKLTSSYEDYQKKNSDKDNFDYITTIIERSKQLLIKKLKDSEDMYVECIKTNDVKKMLLFLKNCV